MDLIKHIGEIITRKVVGGFYLYLALLWLLNIADIIQTVTLSQGGNLKREANVFMEFFLNHDWRIFIVAKILPLMLVTVMVIRGYYDKKGTKINGRNYTPEEMRKAIVFLLAMGVVYYLIVVFIPFVTILLGFIFL